MIQLVLLFIAQAVFSLDLRIPLKMDLRTKVPVRKPSGEIQYIKKMIPGGLKYLLVDSRVINHFFVDGIHIESTPLSVDFDANRARVKLSFSKIESDYEDLENTMGQLTVEGGLSTHKKGVYSLDTFKTIELVDESVGEIYSVIVGQTPKRILVSKLTTTGRTRRAE